MSSSLCSRFPTKPIQSQSLCPGCKWIFSQAHDNKPWEERTGPSVIPWLRRSYSHRNEGLKSPVRNEVILEAGQRVPPRFPLGCMSPTPTSEYPQLLEIDTGESVQGVTFTASSEHLVSCSIVGVGVWRVADGQRVVAIPARDAFCVAASNDGRWIAGGTTRGEVFVWDATTYEQVFVHKISSAIFDVDFSPDSTRLVSADGGDCTDTIWDFVARQKVRTLDHDSDRALAAKYSPQGDRIVAATAKSIRVWDSDDGRLLVDIKVLMEGWRNLIWRNNHIFVLTKGSKIKQINAATGSIVSEWSVPEAYWPCIALPHHGKFIACSTENAITFWDTSAHTQLAPIQHAHNAGSIACSPDGQLLVIASKRKFIVKVISSVVFPFLQEPELHIGSAAFDAWTHGQLTDAEALLSVVNPTSENRHHVLASRALVRTRLGQYDAALIDAEESIEVRPSVVGYIAKYVALVGVGKEDEGCGLCDAAVHHYPSYRVFILLIKAVVLFMAGERVHAISLLDDLITDSWVDPTLYAVQAYMHLHIGNQHMESGNYECAIQSFQDARIKLGNRARQPPLIISLVSGWRFDGLAIAITQYLCDALLAAGRAKEAGEIVLRVTDQEINATEHIKMWVSDLKYRCCNKLEDLGDDAMNTRRYNEAVSQYTAALSLDPAGLQHLLVKRSKALIATGTWKNALNDANEVIKLDPSSSSGYETKYAALLGMGHHEDAINIFETMLSKMSQSSDPEIRERSHHYVRPEQILEVIRASIKNAIHDSPLVLINTLSGRLCNKSEQAATFESTSAFTTLVTSMTTQIDHALIEQVVRGFYRYATFSHTWEGNEPLYQKVIKIVVYDLETFPTHEKLRMFCKIARDEGFDWAWSDTCCIDKGDHFVLQEALISMFKWYEGSAMTIIFLCDVDRLAELGALTSSKWNSRGWTLQEYHASKVVRIYTKDWTPYLGLAIYNYKESPEIISEMERATGIPALALMALRPGLSDIREKLHLASTRQTTRVEDAAYSLLGIFSLTLPVTYGEGDKALGRLLSQLLMSSGDASILAWTGSPNSFNSCLPANIIVFSQPPTSHIPPAIADSEMGTFTARLHVSSLDLSLLTRLYDQLKALSLPFFVGQRMKLPCLAFKVDLVSTSWKGAECIFRVQAGALGVVDIKTNIDISRVGSLYLVHPWINFLLGRQPVRSTIEAIPDEITTSSPPSTVSPTDKQTRVHQFLARLRRPFGKRSPQSSEEYRVTSESTMRAYEFLARLRQPFGALLLAPTRENAPEYKRIVTDSLITVQVEEITSVTLNGLIQGVQVLDVL